MGLTLTPTIVRSTDERTGVYAPLREHARGVFGLTDDGATHRGAVIPDSIVGLPGRSGAGGGKGVEATLPNAGADVLGEDVLCQV
mgnify:CR=1 FL=1